MMPSLSIDDVKSLITFCSSQNVSHLKFGDLEFTLTKSKEIVPAEKDDRSIDSDEEDESLLMLENPHKWEQKQFGKA